MKYRLTHYNYLAWQIEEEVETEKGNLKWRTIKYPGSLRFAVSGLLDLEQGMVTVEDAKTLMQVVKDAESRILAEIKNMIVERKKT